jgi:FlaA1/EpsC-like NDP-sugar epimerase
MENKSTLSKIWTKLKNLKNKILSKVPGAGYKRREALREWDRTVRYYSVRLLDDTDEEINRILKKVWIEQRDEKLRDIIDGYRAELNICREKIKNAPHGYMPSWAPGGKKIAVREQKLKKVIEIDEEIMKTCEQIKERTRKFNDLTITGNIGEDQARTIIQEFNRKLRIVKDYFDERYRVLYEFASEKGEI